MRGLSIRSFLYARKERKMNTTRWDLRATAGKRKADYRKKEQKDKKIQENWDNRVALPTIGGVRSIVNKKENFFIVILFCVSTLSRKMKSGERNTDGDAGQDDEDRNRKGAGNRGAVTTGS